MEISELTLKLIIVLLPGIIACIIFERLTIHSRWTPFKFVYNSVLFGVTSYLTAHLLFRIFHFLSFKKINFFKTTIGSFESFWNNISTKDIHFEIVIWASFASVLISLLASYLDHKKVLNRFAKDLGVTTKYGDESLFYKFLNSDEVFEVYIRDLNEEVTYHGLIESYSESEGCSEIVLYDVEVVVHADPTLNYELEFIYLCKNRQDLIIEVPKKGD